MYVTPPDTDVYAIPRVLAPMPQKVLIIYLYFFGKNAHLADMLHFGFQKKKHSFFMGQFLDWKASKTCKI